MQLKMTDFSEKLILLILPITFQQLMLALVGASDALMLGMLSQNVLSAVSLACQITFVENLFLAAMTIGLFPYLRHSIGAKMTGFQLKNYLHML